MSNDVTGIEASLDAASSNETADAEFSGSALDTAVRIKLIRNAFGFSQRELAKRAGVTNSSISMIEQGQVSPSIQSLSRILAVFPISLTDFFSFRLPRGSNADNSTYLSAEATDGRCPQLDARLECIAAGQSTAFGALPADSCGVVLEGSVQLTLITGKRTLSQGDSFYIPAFQPHRFINLSESDASLYCCSPFVHKR